MIANRQDVYDYLLKRGVTRLCHFTKTKSFVHILNSSDGILATSFIKSDVKEQNDMNRLDNNLDYVCCSIEYPNSWYWEKVKSRDNDAIFRDWIILCIDLEIIKHQKIKFCPCNAASGNGRYIREELSVFDEMYKEELSVSGKLRFRTHKMLACCPTDDQAEILIYSDIPLRYIKGIVVGSETSADNIQAILMTCNKKLDIFVAPDVCNTNWSTLVRNGLRPAEKKFVEN